MDRHNLIFAIIVAACFAFIAVIICAIGAP